MGQPFWNLFNRLDGCAREGLAVLFYGGSWRWRRHPATMTGNIHQWRRQRIRVSFRTDGGRNQERRPCTRPTSAVSVRRTASGNDDGQHIPMATAAHTTRYDLQADMVADIMARRLLHSVLTMTAAHTANVGGYDLQADMVADIMARRLLNGMEPGRRSYY